MAASNASNRHSCWPSMIAAPDGTVPRRLVRHRAGVATCEIRAVAPPDASTGWLHMGRNRKLYRAGAMHNGRASRCRRARDRRCAPAEPA